MIGAERGPGDWGGWDQYHPATIHWQRPGGGVSWLRVAHGGGIDAVASAGALQVTARPPADGHPGTVLRVDAGAGASPPGAGSRWALPGLDLTVTTDGGIGPPKAVGEGRHAPASVAGEARFEIPLAPPGAGEALRLLIEVSPRS